MEKYQILKELVKFNTIKDYDNEKIINFIEKILKNKGFSTDFKGKNLIMSYGKNPTFGFLGHTDTVEYIDGWDTNPFRLVEKDNKLYGLGVCDMKGGIAAILDAILSMNLEDVKNGIKLYFTYDEEREFRGVHEIVHKKEVFPKFMVFGEPTYNEILNGCKGLLELDLYFNGIKVHSSNPDKGKSANLNAVKFLNELEEFYIKEIKNEIDTNYDIPYTTMNLGILKGGSAKNSIPAECYATLDFRLITIEHSKKIIEKIKELSEKYDCNYKIIECIDSFINEVEVEKQIKTANFITEASFIKCDKKIILGVGPVTAHEVNEYIEKESYDNLVKQYKMLMKKFA